MKMNTPKILSVLLALTLFAGLATIASPMMMTSSVVYAEDKDNDNGKGNNDHDNGKGNDENGNSDKKDSPSDDDSGGGNDPPNN